MHDGVVGGDDHQAVVDDRRVQVAFVLRPALRRGPAGDRWPPSESRPSRRRGPRPRRGWSGSRSSGRRASAGDARNRASSRPSRGPSRPSRRASCCRRQPRPRRGSGPSACCRSRRRGRPHTWTSARADRSWRRTRCGRRPPESPRIRFGSCRRPAAVGSRPRWPSADQSTFPSVFRSTATIRLDDGRVPLAPSVNRIGRSRSGRRSGRRRPSACTEEPWSSAPRRSRKSPGYQAVPPRPA